MNAAQQLQYVVKDVKHEAKLIGTVDQAKQDLGI